MPDLVKIVAELERDGIGFESLAEKIETNSANGKLTFHIFAALAEFERNHNHTYEHARSLPGADHFSRRANSSPSQKIGLGFYGFESGDIKQSVSACV